MAKHPHSKSHQLIWGVVILAMGLVFLLDNLYILEARYIMRFWPVILVVFGILKVMQSPGHAPAIFGWGLIAVGTLMTLHRLDIIFFRFRDWWPLILILVGAAMMARGWLSRRSDDADQSMDGDVFIRHAAFMGGFERKNSTVDFRGGDLTAVMGGLKIDFRKADIQAPEAVIEVFAFWGGIEILVSPTWSVSIQGTPVLGGFEDRTTAPTLTDGRKLVIRGYAIMGGVEVHH